MMRLSLSEVAVLTDGQLHGDDCTVHGMIHDSRRVQPGMLFIALAGERSDGHDFLDAAAEQGAVAALVQRLQDHPLAQVVVDDPLIAMGRIASAWRRRLDLTVIGITGSNGKTTVKEMIAAIVSAHAPTLATAGNYNNEIGLPLTLAGLDQSHRFAVIEMGASRSGDIRYLAELARPDIGVLTNAGSAHLASFGSLEGVARTKGELFESLPDSGLAVINADDAFAPLWKELATGCKQLSFGMSDAASIRGRLLNGSSRIETPAGGFDLHMSLPGRHNLMNALAATAVALHLEIPLAEIASALGALNSLPGRLQTHQHPAGWCLIDDTYNANPASLYAGLQVLADMPGEAWLVLGDMAELGPTSSKLHAEMGQSASDLGVKRLFSLGQASSASSLAFGAGGSHFESHEQLIRALVQDLRAGVNCLVKGSRSMAMERIVQALIEEKG